MPKLLFTKEELAQYFNGRGRHKAYEETVKMAMDMEIHAEGVYPQQMVEERRPSESIAVKEYRKKIWKPITKPTFGKVVTELNKIRRSSDWSIRYDDSKIPPRILPEEVMQEYCEKNYPFFNSVTNWVFKVLLPSYLKDANSLVVVMPLGIEKGVQENEYVRPFGYLFHSHSVIDYVQDDYAVIKSTDKVVYTNDQGAKWYGDVYYIITTQFVQRWEQTNGTSRYSMKWQYNHNIGQLPAFRVEGFFKKSLDNTFVFESRLSSMLPRLDEALREYSDLQAEVVQHVFNEKWELISDDCPKCKGKGVTKAAGFNGEEITCVHCEGTGAKPKGPYSNHQLRMPMAGETMPPMPPVGYVQKQVEIVKIQDERIDKHVYNALSAINMEYLHETPLNQSGTAKEVDKDALNNFVNSIAEDLVATMDRLYFFIGEYRYILILPNAEARKDLLPYINVPEKFDILSSTYLEGQIAKQKENKGNPIIINAMEEDYVNKKFAGDTAMKQRILLSIRLDPLAGLSEDDKMTRLSNKGITEETYIISCNIKEFIDRAVDEKGEAFFSMKLKEQKALMMEFAKEQTEANQTSSQVLDGQFQEGIPSSINSQSGNTGATNTGGKTVAA